MKIGLVLLLILLCQEAYPEVRSFGHLASRNDYIMEDRRCTLGIEFTGCRVNSTLIGTSPFLFFGYDLNSLFVRQRINENDNLINTLDLSFVFNNGKKESDAFYYAEESNLYDMQAGMFNFITTFKLQEKVKLSWNNSLFYYSNYKRPFSLRRPDPKVKKLQLNSTVLLENFLTDNLSMASELGLLQFNGHYPRVQAGASLDFHGTNFTIKLGFSVTTTWSGFFVSPERPARNDYQQELLLSADGFYQNLDMGKSKYDFALHPEINYQYFF